MVHSVPMCIASPQKECKVRGHVVRAGRGGPFREAGGLMEIKEEGRTGDLGWGALKKAVWKSCKEGEAEL